MKTYTTIQGDMWDSISYKVYGTEKHVGLLMKSNPRLLNIFIFSAGTTLSIPDVDIGEEADKPVWR